MDGAGGTPPLPRAGRHALADIWQVVWTNERTNQQRGDELQPLHVTNANYCSADRPGPARRAVVNLDGAYQLHATINQPAATPLHSATTAGGTGLA